MEPTALSLDPIGRFLIERHPPGTAEVLFERDRVRLAEFRHAFPGLSLQRLGPGQITEYCRDLERKRPSNEVAEIRALCEDFARFAHREPTMGSGLLILPDVGPERETPYLLQSTGSAPEVRRPAAPARDQRRLALPLMIGVMVLLLAAAVMVAQRFLL